jgi:hypothetical protein
VRATTPEKLALKRATGEMIRGVGGLEAAAGFCRVGKSVLGCNQSPNEPDSFVALDVLADLEPLARGREGWPHVTRALAAQQGFALVKLPDALPEAGDLLHLVARQAREGGAIASAICAALADGKVDADEARAARKQVADLIDVAVAMDAALAAIEGKR